MAAAASPWCPPQRFTCGPDPACATAPNVIDFVGYGPGAVSFEGTAAARSPGVERALLRDAAGCTDRNDNATDFLVRLPPRAIALLHLSLAAAADATPVGPTPVGATPVAGLVRIHDIQGAEHRSPLLGQTWSTCPGGHRRRRQSVLAAGSGPMGTRPPRRGSSSSSMPSPRCSPGMRCWSVDWSRSSGRATRPATSTTELTEPSIQTVGLNQLEQILPTVLGPAGRLLPTAVIDDDVTGDVEAGGTFDASSDGLDFWESLEGMLVQLDDAVVVGPRSATGCSRSWPVAGRGRPAARRGGIALTEGAAGTDFNPERILLDDALIRGAAFGDIDTGAHLPDPVTGVVDYSFARYRVLPTAPVTITPARFREATGSAGPHELAIATFNVENRQTTSPDKFARLAEILVDNLAAPDLVVLEEVRTTPAPPTTGSSPPIRRRPPSSGHHRRGGPLYQYREIAPLDGQDGGQQRQHSGRLPVPHRSRPQLCRPPGWGRHHRGAGPARSAAVAQSGTD